MAKKILIPTDFTVESLTLVKKALLAYPADEIDFVLVHGLYLPESITQLLFFSVSEHLRKLENESFKEAVTILKNKHVPNLQSLTSHIFTGITQTAFNNFITAHNIGEAYIPASYILKEPHRNSFSIIPFIKNSRLPFTEVIWDVKHNLPEKDKVAELFIDYNEKNR